MLGVLKVIVEVLVLVLEVLLVLETAMGMGLDEPVLETCLEVGWFL